jgi:predicted RecB family nuclease
VSTPLRGDEIVSCRHRVALSRGAPDTITRTETTDEMRHRRDLAEGFRRDVLAELSNLAGAEITRTAEETASALARGVELLLSPRVPDDVTGHRRASVHALVRLGRRDERFVYAPLLIKNSEVVEPSTTRELLATDLQHLSPALATARRGLTIRSTVSLTRSGIALAHATRVLQSLGYGDESARVALVDRHRNVWWFDLAGSRYSRFNLATYDALYVERRALLDAHDEWRDHGGAFPTSPYWHRECDDCVYREHCAQQLEAIDDVSLTHFTNFEQQRLLHEFGVHTRRDLARLDPHLARLARRSSNDSTAREAVLGLAIERLEDLIYRARVEVTGSLLRSVEPDEVGCPRADVEVDVDMESVGEHTYLWGATVRRDERHGDLPEGYHSFVVWDHLDDESEARNFAKFWSWFSGLREQCQRRGLSFAAYCFWAQAEDGAMNRAVDPPLAEGPTRADLDEFRSCTPPQWIDLHVLAKTLLQTGGPLGLKMLARAAGFEWRDDNPSGEASMRWYECARGPSGEGESDHEAARDSGLTDEDGDTKETWRQRILEYNEDDCRATQALRDWLNGAAQNLAHRDDPVES